MKTQRVIQIALTARSLVGLGSGEVAESQSAHTQRPSVAICTHHPFAVAAALTIFLALPFSLTLAGAAGRATMSTPDTCAALSTLWLPDTVITAAALVPAQGSVPAYCRVLATVEPETDIEVRLPDTWQGRMLHLGGSGFEGVPTKNPVRIDLIDDPAHQGQRALAVLRRPSNAG